MSTSVSAHATLTGTRWRVLPVGLLALALAGSTLVAQPSSAPAAAGCSGDPVVRTWQEPDQVALGISKTKSVELTAATRVECAVKTVKVTVSSRLLDDTFALTKYASTVAGLDYWAISYDIAPKNVDLREAGRWSVDYTVTGAFGSRQHESGTIRVRRASRLSLNAKPEPVGKGRVLTITGELSRGDWEKRHYVSYGKQKVELQWRSPKGSYHRVKQVTGRGDGRLRTTVKASRDGCYRFSYAGAGATAPTKSVGDCVDVRG